MSAHSKLSPSKRHRWALCPGSVREEAKFPEEKSGPSAIDGTHSHTLLEFCIDRELSDPFEYVGATLKDHEGQFIVDRERAGRVKIAIDYIRRSCVNHFNGLAKVLSEQRVDPKWFLHRDDLGGTVDCQIIGEDILEIIDYKDGIGIVEAEDNLQLEQYAIGKLAECNLAWNVPNEYPWREVRMTIIQPKAVLKGRDAVTTWVLPISHLLDRINTLSTQAIATDDINAPLVPGESQCRFCKAKGSCSALANNALNKIGVSFSALDLAQQSADKEPSQMENEQIRQVMEAAPLIRQFIDAVEKEALRRLESGVSIPGLKLVHGRGARCWSLPEKEMADRLVKMGIPKTAIYETNLVSPAKAEKLTWEKRDGTTVSLTANQLKRLDQEYITKITGKLTVVPESDPRPGIVTDASSMFSAVESQSTVESLPSWLS